MKQVSNVVLAVITGLIVIVAILAAIFANRDQTARWAPDSPEATVQNYVQAVTTKTIRPPYATRSRPGLQCEPLEQSYYPQDTAISPSSNIDGDRATWCGNRQLRRTIF